MQRGGAEMPEGDGVEMKTLMAALVKTHDACVCGHLFAVVLFNEARW